MDKVTACGVSGLYCDFSIMCTAATPNFLNVRFHSANPLCLKHDFQLSGNVVAVLDNIIAVSSFRAINLHNVYDRDVLYQEFDVLLQAMSVV